MKSKLPQLGSKPPHPFLTHQLVSFSSPPGHLLSFPLQRLYSDSFCLLQSSLCFWSGFRGSAIAHCVTYLFPETFYVSNNWIWLGFPLRSSQDFYIFLVVLGWLVCECSCLFSSCYALLIFAWHMEECPVNVWQANGFALLAKPPWTAQRTMICYVISYSPYGQNFTIWLHKQTTWVK